MGVEGRRSGEGERGTAPVPERAAARAAPACLTSSRSAAMTRGTGTMRTAVAGGAVQGVSGA